jgi:hypothetical protein
MSGGHVGTSSEPVLVPVLGVIQMRGVGEEGLDKPQIFEQELHDVVKFPEDVL